MEDLGRPPAARPAEARASHPGTAARRDPIKTLAAQTAPALIGLPGVGAHVAAQLLAAAGDSPDPMHSDAAFAKLCGACPIPADAEKGNTPGACHEGISDTGELVSTIPCPAVAFNPGYEPAVSTARLATYRAIGQSDDHAWELYRWNIDLAAAFTPLACDVEVTLRNTVHDRLVAHLGRTDWWASNDLVLDDITNETLAEVVRRHKKQLAKGTVGPGKIVADLMLGTWVMLLSRGGTSALGRTIDYEANLWRPALRFGFASGTYTPTGRARRPTRDAVHLRASNLQRLRNRAAHHEPIFNGVKVAGTTTNVALQTVWDESVELLGWMAPDLAALHQANPAVPALLAARP